MSEAGQAWVLVVEDERPIANLLARLVEECGAETQIAYNGGEALRRMVERRPDLVLLDLIMPLMSGEEVLETMGDDAQLADVPVIIITTREMMTELPREPVAFLQKPFDPAEVKQLVREVLGTRA
jgi:twitching motility two-component system response regulator PilH